MSGLATGLLLAGCAETETIPLHFDGPVAAAVLDVGDGGPFTEPLGLVANSRNGTIIPLDMRSGRLMTDDASASFLRASALATGRERILADVAVTALDGTVTAWAADTRYRQLLRVPYVISIGEDGTPVEYVPTVGDATFVDADGSGDSPTLKGLRVRSGFTTTEDWSIESDGDGWWAVGSRSGQMESRPKAGKTYTSDDGEVSFTIEGSATNGDRFEFHTETGIDEVDLGGLVMGLHAREGRVYASVLSTPPTLAVFDAASGGLEGTVTLSETAQPLRLASAADGRVFITDGQLPTIWIVRFDQDFDPSTTAVESLTIDAPAVDVAWQAGDDEDGESFEHLFVAPFGTQRVDVYDLAAGAWIDPNPVTAVVEGIDLGSPVQGLGASVGTVVQQQANQWGAYPRVPTIAVATSDGYVFQLDASTGCAVEDAYGPRSPSPLYETTGAYAVFSDLGSASTPEMVVDNESGEQVTASGCGGVTVAETWTVVWEAASLEWRVDGSNSGSQERRARLDQRYVSDTGAVSFLIVSGALPPTEGDSFTFSTVSGLLVAGCTDGDLDDQCASTGTDVAWEFPGRPATFSMSGGPSGGGWDEVYRREFALVPITDGDIVGRVMLDSGAAQVAFE
jgi:hypothetical protein